MAAAVIAILVDLSSRTKFLSRASSSSFASKMGSDSKPSIRLTFSSVTSKAEASHQTTGAVLGVRSDRLTESGNLSHGTIKTWRDSRLQARAKDRVQDSQHHDGARDA